MKWALVLAGLKDINRPVEQVSMAQTTALATTGVIWARYCTQITPKNWNLLAVNVFVGMTGIYTLGRVYKHNKAKAAGAEQQTAPVTA